MTRDDIIRMARVAGMERVIDIHKDGTRTIELPHPDLLERFAHLVYEATFRDANIAASRTILDAAVLEEREACAALCEQLQDWPESSTPYDCAAAIRARNDS